MLRGGIGIKSPGPHTNEQTATLKTATDTEQVFYDLPTSVVRPEFLLRLSFLGEGGELSIIRSKTCSHPCTKMPF